MLNPAESTQYADAIVAELSQLEKISQNAAKGLLANAAFEFRQCLARGLSVPSAAQYILLRNLFR